MTSIAPAPDASSLSAPPSSAPPTQTPSSPPVPPSSAPPDLVPPSSGPTPSGPSQSPSIPAESQNLTSQPTFLPTVPLTPSSASGINGASTIGISSATPTASSSGCCTSGASGHLLPPNSSLLPDSPTSIPSRPLRPGPIAGGVVGGLVVLIVACFLLRIGYQRRFHSNRKHNGRTHF